VCCRILGCLHCLLARFEAVDMHSSIAAPSAAVASLPMMLHYHVRCHKTMLECMSTVRLLECMSTVRFQLNDEFVELELSLHRAYLVQNGAYRTAWLVTRTLVLCAIESHC
jgi:hypothetical protein